MTMLIRALLLVGILVIAFAAVGVANRRRGRVVSLVPPGLSLVVASGCMVCGRARSALDAAGGAYRVVDVHDATRFGIAGTSVSCAFVGDAAGRVVMVRRGGTVASDARDLLEAAHLHGPADRRG